jgi:hypothetical protein
MLDDPERETLPATRCAPLPATSPLLSTTKPSDVHRAIARLVAAYGDQRVADPARRQLLVREWVEAFGPHNPDHLHEAVGRLIQTSTFWPSIAELLTEVRSLRKSIVEDVQRQRQKALPRHEKDDFARHGRSEAEEMAFRAAVVLNAKKHYGWVGDQARPALEGEPDPVPYVVPVSDASPALRAAMRKREVY